MKDSQTLISSLVKLPYLKKLKQAHDLKKISVFLNKNTKEHLLFIFPKNHQILFAFKNPVICNEFNKYMSGSLTNSLKQNSQFFPSLPKNFILKGYVPLNTLKHYTKNQTTTIQSYQERAMGNFQNHCNNPILHQKLEALREVILDQKQ